MQEKKEIRVAFYVRVSTPEQEKSGYGLDYQYDALNDLIKYRENQDPKWITDKKWYYEDAGLSGGDLNRPAYTEMIEDAKKGKFDMIAVWKIDRMSRNLSHLLKVFEDLKSYNVGFYSIKENIDFTGPIGKLTFQIFGALAEFEKEMIKSRTIEGKLASARQGNYVLPSAPYGYKKVKNLGKGNKLKIIEEEKKIIVLIFQWFVYDDLNYSEIARRLNDMKVPKGQGGIRKNIEFTPWYDTTVKDRLTQVEYSGSVPWSTTKDGEKYDVVIDTPIIIPSMVFDLAQEKVVEVQTEKPGGGIKKFLLSGKITDYDSGRKFVGVKRTKGGHSYRVKKQIKPNGDEIKGKEFPGKPLDDFVWEYIKSFLGHPEKFFKLYKKHSGELKNIDRYKKELIVLDEKITDFNIQLDNIEKRLFQGKISDDKADRFILEVKNAIAKTEKSKLLLNSKVQNILNIKVTEEVVSKIAINYNKNIDNLTLDQKIRLVSVLVQAVYVSRNKDGDLEVDVVFKFNPDYKDGDDNEVEPKNSQTIKKSTDKSALLFDYGAPCRARTYDPQVRSLVLFQLS